LQCISLHFGRAYIGDLLGKAVHKVTHNGGEHPIAPVLLNKERKMNDEVFKYISIRNKKFVKDAG
jgi:hypothetical protein